MDTENNYASDLTTDTESCTKSSINSYDPDETLFSESDPEGKPGKHSKDVESDGDSKLISQNLQQEKITKEKSQIEEVTSDNDHVKSKRNLSDKKLYIDDEVCRILEDGSIEFGVVSPVDDFGCDLHVIWTAHDRVESQSVTKNFSQAFMAEEVPHVALIDRKLECGDLINLESDGEFGEVVNVDWVAYIQVADTETAIVDIPCRQLEPILPFEVGNRVELNGWIGVVNSVKSSATLLFSDGKSCKVTYSDFQPDKTPYAGRKVFYSTEELRNLGTKYLESGENIYRLYGDNPPDAYIVFYNVISIDVEWKYYLAGAQSDNCDDQKPNSTIARRLLKSKVRNIDIHRQQWGSEGSELLDKFYYYTKNQGDISLSIASMELKNHIISEFFLEDNDSYNASSEADTSVPSGAPDVVNILRTCRVIDVAWENGFVDSYRSCDTNEKVSFKETFRQIVQRKSSLSASTSNDYGVTLRRNIDDTVVVKWFNKGHKDTETLYRVTTTESKYDLDYHFKYGKIRSGEIVLPSVKCTVSNDIFEFGCVDTITSGGNVIITCYPSNTQESLTPFDIEVRSIETSFTGMRETNSEKEFLRKQCIDITTEEEDNVTIQTSLFSSCLRNYNLSTIPLDEKFEIIPHAPKSHYYYSMSFEYTEQYILKVEFDRKMLLLFFSEGIWVKAYKDRPDLYSAMMVGRKGSPYEDGLFNFDIQLAHAYPDVPPSFYMTTSLSNPDFPCPFPFSLLVPGSHHFSRLYTLKALSLLESLLAVNKFIFEPNIKDEENVASFLTEEHNADNRDFYCQVTISILDSFFKLLAKPPTNWCSDIVRYIQATTPSIITRLSSILLPNTDNSIGDEFSRVACDGVVSVDIPYPLTKGFITSLENRIRRFQELNEIMAGQKL